MKLTINWHNDAKKPKNTICLGIETTDVFSAHFTMEEAVFVLTQEQALQIVNMLENFAHTGKIAKD